jgi:hypothetical protein
MRGHTGNEPAWVCWQGMKAFLNYFDLVTREFFFQKKNVPQGSFCCITMQCPQQNTAQSQVPREWHRHNTKEAAETGSTLKAVDQKDPALGVCFYIWCYQRAVICYKMVGALGAEWLVSSC